MDLINALRDGVNIYDPATTLGIPFHMTVYAPLFNSLVAALPAHPTNPFFTGRILAALFMLGAAVCLFGVPRARGHLFLPLMAFGAFFLIHPVVLNTVYQRSDPAALFLSVIAVMSCVRALEGPRRAALTGALCVLAVATKQSYVAALLACGLYLLVHDRRATVVFATAALAVGALLAAVASYRWGRGFWFCILLPATNYPRQWDGFVVYWQQMAAQPVFLFIVAAALISSYRAACARSPSSLVTESPYFLYMLMSWVTQTIVLTGAGAAGHYLIEPVLASLLWSIRVLGGDAFPRSPRWAVAVTAAVFLLCVGVEFRTPRGGPYFATTRQRTEEHLRHRDEIERELVRLQVDRNRMLNFRDSQISHDFSGTISVNDPFLYFVLWEARIVDTAPLHRAIEHAYFDAIFVSPGLMSAANQDKDNPVQELIREIFRHYALRVHGAELNVLTPIR